MAKKKRLSGHNANYDYKQYAPAKPMGNGSFANLPGEAMFRSFSGKTDYRSGIPNNPVMSVDFMSQVDENGREYDGHDSA